MSPKRAKPTERPTAARSGSTKPPPMKPFEHDGSITKALAVVAHPDDVDFGMAGTVATLTSLGIDVAYCLVTSGDAGGDDLFVPHEERASIREDEQRKAAACVGVTDVTFLGHSDGMVEVTLALRKDIARVIRRVRPDLVLTQSPERNYDRIYASHPDHLATGEATLRAVYPDARNPHAFTGLMTDEGLEPHTVPQVWIAGNVSATLVIDTTATIDRKIEALRQHRSQVGDGERIDPLVREWGAAIAKSAGLPKGRTAEAYRVVSTA